MEHDVKVHPSLAFRSFDGTYYPQRDVELWLKTNLGKRGVYSSRWGWKGRWTVSHRATFSLFSFANKRDAVLFKLTWGGREIPA